MNRRDFLIATAAISTGIGGCGALPEHGFLNPCLPLPTPERLARHELVQAAWEGINPALVWDVHVHLAGVGDSGGGVWINPALRGLFHPFEFVHGAFYFNAACVTDESGKIDSSYVERLVALQQELAPGMRLMLLALDYHHDAAGNRVPDRTFLHVPNHYASWVAQQHPGRFEWIASIHPYRPDCVEALESALRQGARAIKWVPSAMGINPASSLCDRFYEALTRLSVPLLSHAGYEHPVMGTDAFQEFNNPLALRRALEHGVRVIAAHCASTGVFIDTDRGANGPVTESFLLFKRLMEETRFEGRLFGDISGVIEPSRTAPLLRQLIEREDWQSRLLHGSDYPLPGYMPGLSMTYLVEERFITAAEAQVLSELRQYNPLLFDFVLKRHLKADGKRLSTKVFETRRMFWTKAEPISGRNSSDAAWRC